MTAILNAYQTLHKQLDKTQIMSGLAPLLLRLYLGPVLIQAGWNKYIGFENTVAWFGNSDWGLGLPLPAVFATLAISAELVGGILLLLGIAVRWVSIPLIVTMLVAALSVHIDNGWLAISDASSWLANDRVADAQVRLEKAREILQVHGNYEWLTEKGSIVILNNGIEFAATYFIMLLSLFFTGGGRYTSVDYWLAKRFMKD